MKKRIVSKIPLKGLLEVLSQLYNEGVNYIDIQGEDKGESIADVMHINVLPEYMATEEELEADAAQVEKDKAILANGATLKVTLTDEDLDELL